MNLNKNIQLGDYEEPDPNPSVKHVNHDLVSAGVLLECARHSLADLTRPPTVQETITLNQRISDLRTELTQLSWELNYHWRSDGGERV